MQPLPVRIALDAMGGDFAPQETVSGAVHWARQSRAHVLLVGEPDKVQAHLALHDLNGVSVEVCASGGAVPGNASPGEYVRRNPTASVAVATSLVREGQAQAVVSAGNTGASLAAALFILRPLSGIERPAIMIFVPSRVGGVAVLDAGANVDCKPQLLVDFARMGSTYVETMLGCERPPVALISIGEEREKGSQLTKAAYDLLEQSGLNFIGNLEANRLFSGDCRVAVCDGFVGNALLKVCEGFGEFIVDSLRDRIASEDTGQKVLEAYEGALAATRQVVDYAEYGGALLLGVNGVCVICHGRSQAKAVANALRVAQEAVEHQVLDKLAVAMRPHSSQQ